MKDDLNNAFDTLEPSTVLKQKVMSEVNSIENKKKSKKTKLRMRLVAVFSVFILIVAIGIPIGISLYNDTSQLSSMSTFKSYAQLQRFIKSNNSQLKGGGFWGDVDIGDAAPAPESDGNSSSDAPSHSETNTHVKGVDEGDIVKTDGTYIYLVNSLGLSIIKADTLTVSAKIQFSSFSPSELYLPKENDSYTDYIVLTGSYYNEILYKKVSGYNVEMPLVAFDVYDCYPYYSHNSTMVRIYSLEKLLLLGTDKTESEYDSALYNTYEYEYASLNGTRMVNGVLYLILNYYNLNYDNFIVPYYSVNENRRMLPATDITLINRSSDYYTLLLIASIDIKTAQTHISGYVGNGYTTYCSPENLYIAVSEHKSNNRYLGSYSRDYYVSYIYKFNLDKTDIKYDGYFKADGYFKDQFSIDEYSSHLRVATTMRETKYRNNYNDMTVTVDNIVTIFNLGTKKETGRIVGLGKANETIYSARFNGDTAVIVTYLQSDPFYVLDLSNPALPKKVGELEIAGVSDYMQFYSNDETLVFTLGRAEGHMAGSLRGLKAELYDIFDPSNPQATSTYTLGDPDDYSYSEATYNYKAMMAYQNIFAFPSNEYSYTYEYIDGNYYYKSTGGHYLNVYLINETTRTMDEIKVPYMAKELYIANYNVYTSYYDTLRRSVIIGNDLYLIGTYCIQRHSLTDIKNNITNIYDFVSM